MIENLTLKQEIQKNIIQKSDEILANFLQEQITIWDLLNRVGTIDLITDIKSITRETCIGGSLLTRQQDKNSDIDIVFYLSNLDALKEILKKHKIDFGFEFADKQKEIIGRHDNVWFTLGKYKDSPVELYFEEYPIYLQAMPVHINFALKTYQKYPEIKNFVEFLKSNSKNLENPFGYRKAPTFYAEIVFVNDLGYLPKKTENAPRGNKVSTYDGLSPWDWIYMKEVFGKDKALELAKQFI